FHQGKLRSLATIQLTKLLKSKNPYLFRAKNLLLAQDLVTALLDAHISSSEEEHFGQFLEKLAIFIAGKTCDGWKSSQVGIDLEFFAHDTYYLVQIKSGTNWGNSSQQKRLADDFDRAVAAAKAAGHQQVEAVLGICYGNTRTTRHERGY